MNNINAASRGDKKAIAKSQTSNLIYMLVMDNLVMNC